MVFPDSYTQPETNNLLANKVYTSSNASLNQAHLISNGRNNYPPVITNNGSNLFQGGYIANIANVGCLFNYQTNASPTPWWSGVWGAGENSFNIWYAYKGFSIKSDSSAGLHGKLDVGSGAVSSEIDVHSNQQGHTAVIELHSQSPWISKIEFTTTHPTPSSCILLKGSIYFEFTHSS